MAKRKTDKPNLNRGWTQQQYREKLVSKCYEYLYDNFHKFNESKKIQVALTLAQKDMTQKVEMSGSLDHSININITRDNG
jgi:hypothetical protein